MDKAAALATLFLCSLVMAGCGGGGGSSPPTAPGAPGIGQITPQDRALLVAFTPPASDGGAPITQYSATCRAGTSESVTVSGTSSPITVGGLVNGREYACAVTARNSAGDSAASPVANATPFTLPGAPTLNSLTPGDGSIDAVFSAPADNGGNAITEYKLNCMLPGATRSVSGSASPLRLTGLTNGSLYACAVTARNAAGEGASSATQSTTPRTRPSAPAISSVVADVESLVVSFTAPSADGGSPILRYTAQCTASGISRTAVVTASPAIVIGLANNVGQSCVVRATNAAGDGADSVAVTGTPRDVSLDALLSSAVDNGTRRATVTWRDVFPAGTVYRVEGQPGGGSFTARATINGSGGSGATLSWSTDLAESLTLRVVAVRSGRTDILLKTSQATTTVIAAIVSTTNPPTIALSASEPLSGIVTLSITGGVTYPSVEWFINVNRLAAVTQASGPGNPTSWNTTSLANGDYLLIARIQTATNTVIEVRRTVRVANLSLSVSTQTLGSTSPGGAGFFLVARASSSAGIASVEATISGVSLGVLTTPNCPENICAGDYRWKIDTARYPSGSYATTVTAIARDGTRKTIDYTLEVRNPPVLTLETPGDYDIAFARFTVKGSVSSDRAGVLRTSVTLGALTVFESTAANFEGSVDLSGLPGGTYTLGVRSLDAAGVGTTISRTIIVTTSEQRQYTPVLSLGNDVTLLDSDGTHVLHVGGDRLYRLQSLSGGAAVVLAGAESLTSATDWKIEAGRVYAQARGSDCPTSCIYEWDAGGLRRNLSTANPYASVSGTRCHDEDPIVRGNFVMWANWLCGKGQYTILNRSSGTYQKIDPPAGANYIGNNQFDLLSDGSAAFIWAQMGGSGMSSTFDVFRVGGGAATRISASGLRNVYPRSVGTRVVWEQSPIGGNSDGSVELISATIAGSGVRSVATRAGQWVLTEQILAWAEITSTNSFGNVTGRALRVESGGNIATVSSQPGLMFFGATGNTVVFGEEGRFFKFDASQGTRSLILEVAPLQVWATRNSIIFMLGGGKVYRVTP
jgi:hypothetical protein